MSTEEKTILLVDNETIICRDQAEILKRAGYNVITALSGKSAIDKVKNGYKIDLVLMDIDLGEGMDGTQAAEIILRDHDLPLIFLSGHTETEIINKTDKITSYGFVVKNTGENVLLTAIKMAFRLYLAHKENLRQAESLRDSELRYRRLFESAQDGILILDSNSGKIIDVNPYLLDLINYSFDEIMGKTLWEISPFRDIAENKAKFLELKKQGYVHYENLPLLSKNGMIKSVEFISNVYVEKHRHVIQCNIRNIEKRRKTEADKEAILAEKITMLRELQHRIKNSLSIIIGLINMESKRTQDSETREALLRIRNRISSISNLYNILNSLKNMNEVKLDQYIKKMLNELFRSYVNEHRNINLDLHLDKIYIDIDIAFPIGLILNELVTNSLKHAFPDERSGSVRITLERINDEVKIEVSDDGIGFPSEHTINDPKNLGISLVTMLAEQIGGNLEQVLINNRNLFRIKFPYVGPIR